METISNMHPGISAYQMFTIYCKFKFLSSGSWHHVTKTFL